MTAPYRIEPGQLPDYRRVYIACEARHKELGGIAVMCGCQWFEQIEQARTHWLAHKNQQRRDVVIPAMDALLAVAKIQGWELPKT